MGILNVGEDLVWLKHHVILLALVIGLSFVGIYTVESLISKHDHDRAVASQAIADAQAKQNQAFQTTILSELKTLADSNAALQQQNTALTLALATRNQVEAKLPKSNESLSTDDAAKQITTLTGGKATANGSDVVIDTPTAQKVVTGLELVPMLQADKVDLEKQNANFEKEIDNDIKALDLEKQSHVGDVTTLKTQIKADGDALTSCKADARKGKLKWFGIGYALGWASRKIIGF